MRALLGRLVRHRAGLVGSVLVTAFALAGLLAPWLAPYDPLEGDLTLAREAPSPAHVFGTDELGRDVLSRILYGSRISLRVGVIAIGIGAGLGVPVGAISAYWGGWVDLGVQRMIEVVMAFPAGLLAILIVSIAGVGLEKAILALGIVSIPVYARLVRGSVLVLKEMPFIEAARALGASHLRVMRLHILPNGLSPIIVQSSLQFAGAILWVAGLSFLGLGAQPPTPEWGAMLAQGRVHLRTAPHLVLFPGVAISIVVLGLNLLGDALRDALDPHQWWQR